WHRALLCPGILVVGGDPQPAVARHRTGDDHGWHGLYLPDPRRLPVLRAAHPAVQVVVGRPARRPYAARGCRGRDSAPARRARWPATAAAENSAATAPGRAGRAALLHLWPRRGGRHRRRRV